MVMTIDLGKVDGECVCDGNCVYNMGVTTNLRMREKAHTHTKVNPNCRKKRRGRKKKDKYE